MLTRPEHSRHTIRQCSLLGLKSVFLFYRAMHFSSQLSAGYCHFGFVSVACLSVRAINRSTAGFPNANETVVSRFRAAQFRAAQFRAAQSRAAHFSAVHCVLRTGPSRRGKGEKFSRAPRRLGAPSSLKNTENGVPDGFFPT